ncbi:Uncharacterized protein APZ42_018811 [Daphnia magna]|uniref:Uncharacterized protein n=1 Tax=Daphnia magna TaxID=35525 RepID=A0A162CGL5_9CRUS|nr:Uncharacterized protein APZ42_018811 [Daphnia magna]
MTASLSRFAVLRIEDDEDEKAASRARDKQRAAAQKLAESKNKSAKVKLNSEKNAAKKMKAAQEKAELKSLAFGGSKPRKSSAPIKKPAGNEVPSNFKEWKQKDQEFVDDDFEAQLKEAIMASKVDFEANIGEVTKLPEQEDGFPEYGLSVFSPTPNRVTMNLRCEPQIQAVGCKGAHSIELSIMNGIIC